MNRISTLKKQLNAWGKERVPFLLICDFEMRQIKAYPLSDIDPSHLKYQFHNNTNVTAAPATAPAKLQWKPEFVSASTYRKAFDAVRKGLGRGDSFLVNLTFPTIVQTNWSLEDVYQQTGARYKLWLKDKFTVFSPEIFVQIKNGRISSYPMKGTLAGHMPAQLLLDDPKEKAEHATIVDLIRNDLSRVASRVSVDQYRYLERIKTNEKGLWQTSSRISGELAADFHKNLGDVLFKLLPAGSISGAPKTETLNIIKRAEGQARGFYTGVAAIWDGYELDSCVLIRFIEQQRNHLRYWSGGGITAYSNWEEEYRELKEKVYLPLETVGTSNALAFS